MKKLVEEADQAADGGMVGLLAPFSGRHQHNALRWDQIDRKGDRIGSVMYKTGEASDNKLNRPAMRALEKIHQPGRDVLFAYPHFNTQLHYDFCKITTTAGVEGAAKHCRSKTSIFLNWSSVFPGRPKSLEFERLVELRTQSLLTLPLKVIQFREKRHVISPSDLQLSDCRNKTDNGGPKVRRGERVGNF